MKKTILVIEDDNEFQRLAKKILGAEGYGILLAANGEEGLNLARSERPDLILLDVNMPGMDGYEVCRTLRADPDLGRVPIILVTVQSKSDAIVKGLSLGADDYVTKPFDPDEVAARVAALFRQSGREDAR